jgi:hypothetical protein
LERKTANKVIKARITMSHTRTYRKKPVEIQAMLWDGQVGTMEIASKWLGDIYELKGSELYLKTLEGEMHVSQGDYIIQGVKGEFYPCKPDIFAETYELVNWEKQRESDMWPTPKPEVNQPL